MTPKHERYKKLNPDYVRDKTGLSLRALAHKLDCDRKSIYKALSGEASFDLRTTILKMMGKTESELESEKDAFEI